jgi:hypothetical protein
MARAARGAGAGGGMSGTELIRYDAMCQAIAAAYEVDEVKDIRDKARAIEVYARQARNIEAERRACEIRLRAERRCGQLLDKMQKAKGATEPGTNRGATRSHDDTASTLADLGISKTQSSRWQKLAAIPDGEFEAALAEPVRPTTHGLIADLAPVTPVDDRALWLWGRLKDFERLGVLNADPDDLLETMFDQMRETVRELAPVVAAWLERISTHAAS